MTFTVRAWLFSFLMLFAAAAARADLQLNFDSRGLATLVYNGAALVTTQNRFIVGDYIVDGQTSWGGTVTPTWNDAAKKLTFAMSWGQVTCVYLQTGDRLDMQIAITNTSQSTIKGVVVNPMAISFPQMPAGWDANLPQMKFNINGPSVIGADWGTGVLAMANMDVTLPMYTGFTSQGSTTFPIHYGTVQWGSASPLWPVINRDIAPGATENRVLSLRFAPSGTDPNTLMADVYQAFGAAWPKALHWTDHRSIAALIIATANAGWAKNPRGWFLDSNLDVTTPAGVQAFQQRLLQWADNSVAIMKAMGSQGMVTWDIEGEQYPHAFTYVGDPRQAETLAPETVGIWDTYFKKFTDAGFACGLTIRPQHFSVDSGGQPHQDEVADPAQNLIDKIQYAKTRWGCTLYYVDSNGDPNYPYDPAVFQRVLQAVPGILLMPEHKDVKYFAYTTPYHELRQGVTDIMEGAYLTYPDAAGLITVQDGTLTADRTRFVEPGRTQLLNGVKRGNILMYRGWFDDQPFNAEVQRLYAEAGGVTPPPPPTTSPCDVNKDGQTNVGDVQQSVNAAIGRMACVADINQDGQCTVADVQRIVNAVLGGVCVTTP